MVSVAQQPETLTCILNSWRRASSPDVEGWRPAARIGTVPTRRREMPGESAGRAGKDAGYVFHPATPETRTLMPM
jgi:hypothetical protein